MSPKAAALLAQWEQDFLDEAQRSSAEREEDLTYLRTTRLHKRAELHFALLDVREALRERRPHWFWRTVIKP